MKTPPKIQVDTMPAGKYFAYAAELLKLHAPHITDEPIIAMDICEILVEAGAKIVGLAFNVGQALRLVEETEIDAAVSDFRLETMTACRLLSA
jgi:DNA-binding NarL/FixJ family response regulator